MAWREQLHADAHALHAAVARALRQAIDDALAAGTDAGVVLALAGGDTPLPVYRALAAMPLDWARVTCIPGDDRCVPHTHPACNLRQLDDCLGGTGARLQPLTTADGAPAASLALAGTWLAAHPAPFAASVLGMGADGHTASLFPGAANLAQALDPAAPDDVVRVLPGSLPPEAPFERISMTVSRLLRSRLVLLLATGAAKRRVLDQALADPGRYPVGALLHAPSTTVHVHWSP